MHWSLGWVAEELHPEEGGDFAVTNRGDGRFTAALTNAPVGLRVQLIEITRVEFMSVGDMRAAPHQGVWIPQSVRGQGAANASI